VCQYLYRLVYDRALGYIHYIIFVTRSLSFKTVQLHQNCDTVSVTQSFPWEASIFQSQNFPRLLRKTTFRYRRHKGLSLFPFQGLRVQVHFIISRSWSSIQRPAPSQLSDLNAFVCEMCNVIWLGKCSSCKTLLCRTDRYYEVTNNCGIFPLPRKWRWKHEKFRFYKYPFIAGMITTELICFCISVAIVVLSFVFTQLSFHCEMLLRWHKTVHSSTTSRLQSFFCVVCWLYVYCILMLSTTLQGFYFCVCSLFFFKLERLSQCFP
jgi:hypothetical protein